MSGVYRTRSGKYTARIVKNGLRINLGVFEDPDNASEVRGRVLGHLVSGSDPALLPEVRSVVRFSNGNSRDEEFHADPHCLHHHYAIRPPCGPDGEIELRKSVLLSAIEDLSGDDMKSKIDAMIWIESGNRGEPGFTFNDICDILNLNADCVRRVALE